MRRFLVTKPMVEPLTLVEAKRWLRVDHSDDDGLIQSLIQAAREMAEARTGRALIAQGWRVTLDDWPTDRRIELPLSPVLTVTAVRLIDAQGVATPLAAVLIQLEPRAEPPVLAIGPAPPPGRTRNGIEIDLTAGYGPSPGDVPEPLRQAMRLMLSEAYANRGPSEAGAPSNAPAVEALLQPYRAFRLFRTSGARMQ